MKTTQNAVGFFSRNAFGALQTDAQNKERENGAHEAVKVTSTSESHNGEKSQQKKDNNETNKWRREQQQGGEKNNEATNLTVSGNHSMKDQSHSSSTNKEKSYCGVSRKRDRWEWTQNNQGYDERYFQGML